MCVLWFVLVIVVSFCFGVFFFCMCVMLPGCLLWGGKRKESGSKPIIITWSTQPWMAPPFSSTNDYIDSTEWIVLVDVVSVWWVIWEFCCVCFQRFSFCCCFLSSLLFYFFYFFLSFLTTTPTPLLLVIILTIQVDSVVVIIITCGLCTSLNCAQFDTRCIIQLNLALHNVLVDFLCCG